jgi:hypothetical protein
VNKEVFSDRAPAPSGEKVRRRQDRLKGFQNRIGGGCNLNRDTPSIIEAGGFTVARLDTYDGKGEPKPYAYMYEGRAVAKP